MNNTTLNAFLLDIMNRDTWAGVTLGELKGARDFLEDGAAMAAYGILDSDQEMVEAAHYVLCALVDGFEEAEALKSRRNAINSELMNVRAKLRTTEGVARVDLEREKIVLVDLAARFESVEWKLQFVLARLDLGESVAQIIQDLRDLKSLLK